MTPPREPFFKPEDFLFHSHDVIPGEKDSLDCISEIANRLVEPLQKDLELSRKTNAAVGVRRPGRTYLGYKANKGRRSQSPACGPGEIEMSEQKQHSRSEIKRLLIQSPAIIEQWLFDAEAMLLLKDSQLEQLRADLKTLTEAYLPSECGNEFEQVRYLKFKLREAMRELEFLKNGVKQ